MSATTKPLTEEELSTAIKNQTKLPVQLLPWSNQFYSLYGKEARDKYKDVHSMMQQYGEAMQKRDAARQREDAELKDHLRECRAQWRKAKRGKRGNGPQRQASQRVARQQIADRHKAAASTDDGPTQAPELHTENENSNTSSPREDDSQQLLWELSPANPNQLDLLCNLLSHAVAIKVKQAKSNGFVPGTELLGLQSALQTFTG